MSKSKKSLVNTTVVALIIIVYQLLPKNIDFSFLPIGMASFLGYAVYILGYVFSFVYTLVLYSVLILVWGKSKYLLEKPLFDKSLPFAKRFNLGKLVLAFVVSVLSYLVNYATSMLSYIVCPDFNLGLALSGVYMSVFWIVLYFIIAGKGHNIFKNLKHAVISLAVILLATAVLTIVGIGYIRMMNVQGGNITDYIEILEYSTRMRYFEVLSNIIIVCTFVFFHTLSAPEEVPL